MKNSLLQIIVYIKNICEPKEKDFYTFEFCINIQMIPEIKKKETQIKSPNKRFNCTNIGQNITKTFQYPAIFSSYLPIIEMAPPFDNRWSRDPYKR